MNQSLKAKFEIIGARLVQRAVLGLWHFNIAWYLHSLQSQIPPFLTIWGFSLGDDRVITAAVRLSVF